jgi:hypothetical protein
MPVNYWQTAKYVKTLPWFTSVFACFVFSQWSPCRDSWNSSVED